MPQALEPVNHCAMAITHAERVPAEIADLALLGAHGLRNCRTESRVVSHETATVADVLLIRRSGDEALVTDEMLDASPTPAGNPVTVHEVMR